MDSEQIQQQMRQRRAAIDAKLDDLQAATIAASRRTATAFLLVASAGVLAMMLIPVSLGRWKLQRTDGIGLALGYAAYLIASAALTIRL